MKIIKELIPYILIIVVVMLIRTFVATPIIVQGSSMNPTLDGNEIMMLKKYDNDYERFDIVVVDKSVEGDNIIKRIIGLPGETISYSDDILYINNKAMEDPYKIGITGAFSQVTLGEDEYFLMGDNRTVSLDSRVLGAIKKDKLEGTVDFIVFPFNKFGKVKYD